jgi:hypothetical protein
MLRLLAVELRIVFNSYAIKLIELTNILDCMHFDMFHVHFKF